MMIGSRGISNRGMNWDMDKSMVSQRRVVDEGGRCCQDLGMSVQDGSISIPLDNSVSERKSVTEAKSVTEGKSVMSVGKSVSKSVNSQSVSCMSDGGSDYGVMVHGWVVDDGCRGAQNLGVST